MLTKELIELANKICRQKVGDQTAGCRGRNTGHRKTPLLRIIAQNILKIPKWSRTVILVARTVKFGKKK